jgi:hypothetical protein
VAMRSARAPLNDGRRSVRLFDHARPHDCRRARLRQRLRRLAAHVERLRDGVRASGFVQEQARVGGWTQLVRIRPDGPTWAKQRFIVK